MYVLCFTASFRFDGLFRVRIAIFLLEKVSWFFEWHKSKSDQHDATNEMMISINRSITNEMMISELSSLAYPVKLLKKYKGTFHIAPIS